MERGQRLKQLREKKNMSQTEASRFLGVSKQTLYKYENDVITNIPSNIIERMAKLYNTTPGFIMGWEDENGKPTLLGSVLHDYNYFGRLNSYTHEEVKQALDFLDAFKNLTLDRQQAIEALLSSVQSVPSLHQKPGDTTK